MGRSKSARPSSTDCVASWRNHRKRNDHTRALERHVSRGRPIVSILAETRAFAQSEVHFWSFFSQGVCKELRDRAHRYSRLFSAIWTCPLDTWNIHRSNRGRCLCDPQETISDAHTQHGNPWNQARLYSRRGIIPPRLKANKNSHRNHVQSLEEESHMGQVNHSQVQTENHASIREQDWDA